MSEEEKKDNEVLNNTQGEESGAGSTGEEAQGEPIFRVEAPPVKSEEKSAEEAVESDRSEVKSVESTAASEAKNVEEAVESARSEVKSVENTAASEVKNVEDTAASEVKSTEEAVAGEAEKLENTAAEEVKNVETAAEKVSDKAEQFTEEAGKKLEETEKKVEEKLEKKLTAEERIKQNVNKYKPVEKARGDVYEKDASGKKHSGVIVGIAVVILLLVLAMGYAFFPRRTKINLDKYISLSFSGYDGYGEAKINFDEEHFLKDFKKKVKLKKKRDAFSNALFSEYSPEAFLYDFYISGNWTVDGENGKYKNGDKVHLTWSVDKDKIEEDFKVKIKDAGQEYTVKDLEKVETFDAFEDFKIEFSGSAPDGTAQWNGSDIMDGSKGLYFTVDPQYGLSNGDKVTVKIDPKENLNSFVQKTGKAPQEMEKVFTVEGLPAYIDSASKLDDATLTSMKGEVEDQIKSNIAREDDAVQLLSAEYQGYYFLNAKNKSAYIKNIFYPVYKVTVRVTLAEQNFVKDYSFYTSAAFRNIMEDKDGKVNVDLNEMSTLFHNYVIDTGVGDWFTVKYYLDGFETLDSLKNECVTKNLADFKVEEKLSEATKAEPETAESSETESSATESTEGETTTNS